MEKKTILIAQFTQTNYLGNEAISKATTIVWGKNHNDIIF